MEVCSYTTFKYKESLGQSNIQATSKLTDLWSFNLFDVMYNISCYNVTPHIVLSRTHIIYLEVHPVNSNR